MDVDVRIPPLGESVTEGVIVRWLKKDGDRVKADEPLLELETEKAAMEIAAEIPGVLRVVQAAGARVRVGDVVARIASEGAGAAPAASGPAVAAVAPGPAKSAAPTAAASPAPPAERRTRRAPEAPDEALSPAVRKLVTEHAVDPAAVKGTGREGRVTKGDVLQHLEDERGARPAGEAPRVPAPPDRKGARAEADVERVPMTELRRAIATRLVEAQRTAAILTTFNEVDLAALLALRKRYRERFREKHGVDLGLMSLFARAAVLALRDVSVVNARIDGTDIVYHRRVHLGIAVSTPRGLVVPVVRDADQKSLAEIETAVSTLAQRAREAKLRPDDLAGGTFTITNGGVFGSLLSTPLLNPPQAAILGMHKIQERPVAVDGQVVIRPMMYVALSYDHRLIDGEQAVTFLVRVKEQLEDPARMVLEV
ncbi:MAG TPA: 2-oxoglutarate dehydrogenase complex dihydrolipoyllysine-residue succinyltransferase [Methylomirabilota bacterium]